MLQKWIPGLPRIPYRGGVGAWEGVVMHQTANDNDTARGNATYQASHWQNAFVHEFIDPNEIIQVADPKYIAYGAGAVANYRFIHLELCSAATREEFERSFNAWCQRAATFLYTRKLGVADAGPKGTGTLWGHFQVTKYLGGTTHADPVEYLARWGRSWGDVVDRVREHYSMMEGKNMTASDANKIIGFLSAAYAATENQEAKGEFHRLANELRKVSGQPVQ